MTAPTGGSIPSGRPPRTCISATGQRISSARQSSGSWMGGGRWTQSLSAFWRCHRPACRSTYVYVRKPTMETMDRGEPGRQRCSRVSRVPAGLSTWEPQGLPATERNPRPPGCVCVWAAAVRTGVRHVPMGYPVVAGESARTPESAMGPHWADSEPEGAATGRRGARGGEF